MAETPIDLSTWPRATQFHLFRTYDRPHFAVTSRINVAHLLARKPDGVSPYRGCLFAISTAVHTIEALRMRFRGDQVILHDQIETSVTVPLAAGGFGYADLPHHTAFSDFDATAKARIAATALGKGPPPNTGARDDMVYLSCLPWLDYTSITNAMPGPNDCIPRVSWGKFTDATMPMTIEVHHALADGVHVGAFFAQVQATLDAL